MLADISDRVRSKARTKMFGVKIRTGRETKGSELGQVPQACGQPSAVDSEGCRLNAVSLFQSVNTK